MNHKSGSERPVGETPGKIKCWEVFACNEKECPAYLSGKRGCWLFAGTHCHHKIQGKFLEKMEMCLDCRVLKANLDVSAMRDTLRVVNRQFREFRVTIKKRDKELENIGLELSIGLSEVFEALKKISSGDPQVKISERSGIELIAKLKHIVNITAKNIGEVVDQSHEFAIGLAEHFDVLHRVSRGDLNARVTGHSRVELLEALKKELNRTIDSISREITVRKHAEEALANVLSLHTATLESTADGILVVDKSGRITSFNRKFIEMWHIPRSFVLSLDDQKLQAFVLNQVRDPEAFLARIKALYAESESEGIDILEFKDGRVFERHSLPQRIGDTVIGKVWSFRDVTERSRFEEALKESEEKFRTISASAQDAIIMVDDEGRISFWNEAAEKIFGYPASEIITRDIFTLLVPPEHRPLSRQGFGKFGSEGIGRLIGKTTELTALRRDGTEFPISLSVSAVKMADKWNAIGILRDITARKNAERELRASEERYRDLFENTTDLIQIISQDGRFLFVNRAWRNTLGYTDEEIAGFLLWDIVHPDRVNHCKEIFRRVVEGESMQNVEVTFLAKDGRSIELEGNISGSLRERELEYARCIFHDITSRKRMEEELRAMSLRDELTGLYNRRGFMTLAEQQLKIADRMKRSLLLLFADLDGMKQINDTLGHQAGDHALADVALILKETFRGSDIIARVGGDEFVVFALEAGEDYCDLLADRIRGNLARHNEKGERPFKLSMSIGITHYDPGNPCPLSELLARADRIMYEHKRKR